MIICNLLPETLLILLYCAFAIVRKTKMDNGAWVFAVAFCVCLWDCSYYSHQSDFLHYKYGEALLKSSLYFAGGILCQCSRNHFYRQSLIVCTVLGASAMISATDFVTLLFSMELAIIPTYFLVFRKECLDGDKLPSYFVYNSISTVMFVFATCLVCATIETTNFGDVKYVLSLSQTFLSKWGALLLFMPLAIKLGIFSCHAWVIDISAKPAEAIAPIFCVVKIAIMVVCYKTLLLFSGNIAVLLLVIASISMIFGGVMTALQNDLKKILVYMSIFHSGILLVCSTVKTYQGGRGFVFFVFAEIISMLGMFIFLMQAKKTDGQNIQTIRDIQALSRRYPVLGIAITVLLLSLVGFPPFVGFWSMFCICAASVDNEFYIPVVVYLLSAFATFVCVIKIIHAMWLNCANPCIIIAFQARKVLYVLAFLTIAVVPFAQKISDIMRLEGYFVQ